MYINKNDKICIHLQTKIINLHILYFKKIHKYTSIDYNLHYYNINIT